MSHPVTMHQCDYCTKRYSHRRSAQKHETHCWKNVRRTPREGEVYGVDHGGMGEDEDQPWEPICRGLIFVDDTWRPVPGYAVAGVREIWPTVYFCGEPLNKCSREDRLQWFRGDRIAPDGYEAIDVPF